MSRVDSLRSEIERVGVDEFCNRRIYREEMPVKLMRSLQRMRAINEGDIDREYRRPASLTDARREALEGIANGLTDAAIAVNLNCSEAAAKDVVRRTLIYFNARNRAHAVHLAHQQGVIE